MNLNSNNQPFLNFGAKLNQIREEKNKQGREKISKVSALFNCSDDGLKISISLTDSKVDSLEY